MPDVFNPDKSKSLLPQVIKVGLLPLDHVMPNGVRVIDMLTPDELDQATAGLHEGIRAAMRTIHRPLPVAAPAEAGDAGKGAG